MPAGDATGPRGEGAKTGQGLGNCNPASDSKRTFFGFGRGLGRGRGRGFGFRRTSVGTNQSSDK